MIDFTNDPIAAGYADSYNRPGKNVTGVFLDAPEFAGKWVDMLRTVVPRLKQIAVVWDPKPGRTHLEAVQRVTKSVGLRTQVFEVANLDDIPHCWVGFSTPHRLVCSQSSAPTGTTS